ncbi:MAG: Ig-like domain-containing protein, partial [Carboxylicivirga sp.]|nr:Ig-like domain-containing protein [Carboxylicivirga sp.]
MNFLNFASAQEICNNGIDDDGDGLIDFYDSDCQSAADADQNFFYNKSIPTCSAKPPVYYTWTLREKFNTNDANGGNSASNTISSFPIDQRCGLFVGDLDGDGVPEMVGKDEGESGVTGTYKGSGNVRVFSGVNGKHLQSFQEYNHSYTQVALANIDRDNTGDIFLVNRSKYLVRLQYNGPTSPITKIWTSTSTVFSEQQSPQLADFNGDGVPEVYVGNRIFDSSNGNLLLSGGSNNSGRIPSVNDAWPIAYDVFKNGDLDPDGIETFDEKANGLELIAGNKVYLVDFVSDPNNWTIVEAVSTSITVPLTSPHVASRGKQLNDGFTSIGDLTGDGKIDIIVNSGTGSSETDDKSYVYAWNPYAVSGKREIGEAFFSVDDRHINTKKTFATGRSNVADFDGDGELEIGFAGKDAYFLLETDLTLKWKKSNLDDGSRMTGSTVFDFEGDGSAEVVYSDEDILYVWKGSDGRQLASIASPSGTRTDYPLVVDVDDDGQAEIVITSQYEEDPSKSPKHGWISVYRSADAPWVAARETWNQHGYFVTNIEDDLSIPVLQQDFVSPYFNDDFNTAFNQFLVQTTYLTYEAQPTFATGDLTTENVEFELSKCPTHHEVHFTLTFENNGSWKIPRNTPVSYYDGDPYQPGAVYLSSTNIPDNIDPGEEYVMSDMVYDHNEDGKMDLYVLVNHSHYTVDGTPLNLPLVEGTINSPTLECDYDNNLGFIVSIENCVAISTPEIDLDRNNSGGVTGNDYLIGFAIGENETYHVADEDVFIRDTDSPNDLMAATIILTNLLNSGDETLGITTQGQNYADEYGITVNLTSNRVELTGLGNSLLEYERVIKNITYVNSNSNPDQTDRIITFEVEDQYSKSELAQTTVKYTFRPTVDLDADDSSEATGKDYKTTFTEGNPGVSFVDSDLLVDDSDGTTLEEAIITLTNKIDGTQEDIEVPYSLPTGILRDFDELTPGKVRLYGTSSLQNYKDAISSLTYLNTNEDLTAGDRTIEVIINDGYVYSKPAYATVTVIPVNDPPVIIGDSEAVIYTSGNTTILPYPDITDVDNDTIKSATITITTEFVAGGEDQLSFTSDYGITGSFDNTTGILSLSGNATIEEYKAVIATVQFSSSLATSSNNRAVSIKVTDKDDGESNVYHRTVVLINDSGNDTPFAANDAYEVFKSNTLVKAVVNGVLNNDVDPDGDNITINSSLNLTGSLNGSLTLSTDGSFTYNPDETDAVVSALNFGETATEQFTYTIIDDESVESGTSVSNTATITFTIKGENAVPVANDDSYTVDQDSELVTSSPGMLANDTDSDGADELEVVMVSQSFSSVIYGRYGILRWYGDGSFVYKPDESNPDVQALQVVDPDLVETFVYTIEDPGLDSDDATITINIKGTNDAPYVYAEDTDELTNQNTALTFNDANNNKIYVTDSDVD